MRVRVLRVAAVAGLLALATTGATDACDEHSSSTGSGQTSITVYRYPAGSTVYVEDHSGRAWPVKAAVAKWAVGMVDVHVVYGKCRDQAPCVTVTEDDLSEDIGGQTPMDRGLFSGEMHGAKVQFNRMYADDPAWWRTAVACHELGHAMGIESHDTGPDSCMAGGLLTATTPAHPGKRDLAELNNRGGDR
jgi:hypothetical protein